MEKSETIMKLAEALSKAQGMIKGAIRDSDNPYFKSTYADLASVWEACRLPLSTNGLSIIQTTEVIEGKIILTTILLHNSGEYISGRYPINPMRQGKEVGWAPSDDPQSIGSAITYARRYAMSAIVGIAPEDDDGEAAVGRGVANGKKPLIQESQKKQIDPVKKDIETVITAVDNVTQKVGANNKLFYTVHVGNKGYRTFSKTMAEDAKRASQGALNVSMEYKTTQYGPEIVALVVQEPPDEPGANG